MKSFFALLFALLAAYPALQAQGSLWTLQKDVAFLASDVTEGRFSGSKGEQLSARYISERFKEIGLSPKGTEGYYQTFALQQPANPHSTGSTTTEIMATNVIGWLDNGATTTVVIGAHYDHLGHGGHGSRHTGAPDIHNGADDNASGVAAMLYIAEALAKKGPKGNNYLFIGFSGEELGLFGSKYWVDQPTVPLASVNYMLNMDMVGRLDSVLVVNGVGTSPEWKKVLDGIVRRGFSFVTTESGIGPSDHTSFYLRDIPAIHFFTGQHMDYHTPKDDAHLVNYEGLETVSKVLLQVIAQLDGKGRIAFTKTKDETPQRSMGFKVTMGVMPDYTFQGEGMRIDGVIEGRPAQAAGLLNGDILIQMGETSIKSIHDYMDVLNTLKKGDKSNIKVRRGEQVVSAEVLF